MVVAFAFLPPGFIGLNLLLKAKMVNGRSKIRYHNQLWEGCVGGTQHRKSYQVEKSRRAIKQLQLIGKDIINLIKVTSLGGCDFDYRYFITFIDGFSRITSVYFLKEKTKAFSKPWWKHNWVTIKVVETTPQVHLMTFAKNVGKYINWQQPSHHNKMVWLRRRAEQLLTWYMLVQIIC